MNIIPLECVKTVHFSLLSESHFLFLLEPLRQPCDINKWSECVISHARAKWQTENTDYFIPIKPHSFCQQNHFYSKDIAIDLLLLSKACYFSMQWFKHSITLNEYVFT